MGKTVRRGWDDEANSQKKRTFKELRQSRKNKRGQVEED